jgi:hypothetical protein
VKIQSQRALSWALRHQHGQGVFIVVHAETAIMHGSRLARNRLQGHIINADVVGAEPKSGDTEAGSCTGLVEAVGNDPEVDAGCCTPGFYAPL